MVGEIDVLVEMHGKMKAATVKTIVTNFTPDSTANGSTRQGAIAPEHDVLEGFCACSSCRFL
jgi:hypothetical protein